MTPETSHVFARDDEYGEPGCPTRSGIILLLALGLRRQAGGALLKMIKARSSHGGDT
jgi:hypothetical protein